MVVTRFNLIRIIVIPTTNFRISISYRVFEMKVPGPYSAIFSVSNILETCQHLSIDNYIF